MLRSHNATFGDTLQTETFCLVEGDYEFIISDTVGDGMMCCDYGSPDCMDCKYGDAYYNITTAHGALISEGGDFDQTVHTVSPSSLDTALFLVRGESFSRAPPPLSNFIFVRQILRHPFLRLIISSGVDHSRPRRRGRPSPEPPGIRHCCMRIGTGGCKASV